MDLALEMGMTAAGLSRVMTERELADWTAYRAQWMLPTRRLQMQLAQVALMVAASGGAKNAKLQDFLFDPPNEDEPDDDDDDIEAADQRARVMLGFNPRNAKG